MSNSSDSQKQNQDIFTTYQNTFIIGVILFLVFFIAFPRLYDVGNKPLDNSPNNSLYNLLDNSQVNYLHIFVKYIIVMTIVIVIPLLFANNKDNFYFQLTPEKQCLGGKYMYTSDPERQKFCAKFDKADMSKYECPNGFVGAPIWRGSVGNQPPESNADWKNTRCSAINNSYNDPHVL